MHSVADAIPAQIAYFEGPQLRCQFANIHYAQAYQHTPQSIIGQRAPALVGPTTWAHSQDYVRRCLAGSGQRYTVHTQGRDGCPRVLDVNLVPHTEAEQVLGVFVLVYDITDHWQAEQALRESEERMRKFSLAAQEVIVFHEQGVIVDANPAAEALLGYSVKTLRGSSIFDYIATGDQAKAHNYAQQQQESPYEVQLVHRDGCLVDVEVVGKTVSYQGQLQRIVVVRDISARKQAQAQADFITLHDPLTGLPNRQYLLQHTTHALQQLQAQPGQAALLFINLDHFQTINNTLGHYMGDELLNVIAQRLKSSVRPQDFVARLGGDEFVVFMNHLPPGHAVASVAEKLLLIISAPHPLAGMPIALSPSIGISLYPEHGNTSEELLRHANQAMVYAKESGRANSQLYDAFMDGRVPYSELTLERQLRQAIEHEEFCLYYQPQVRLRDGSLAGFEVLVRWQHPERGLVSPDEFIAFAEKRGLISPIGRWVLHRACHQLKAWLDAGLPKVGIAVNVSALELRQRDVLADIQQVLHSTGLAPECLEVEITESVLMQQSSPTKNILTALQNLGVGVSIDDFGTGYSSLAYLKRYPVSKLKIDRSFVTDIPDNPDDVAIVTAIVQMGHSLQLQVVAEGVEHPAQQQLLQRLGCDLIQGYGLSRPLAAEQVLPWWQAWQTRGQFSTPTMCVAAATAASTAQPVKNQ